MIEGPSVTVIVPCRNEAGHLEEMLESLLSNDYPRERLEVVFVDGMSDDGTRELLERAAREHPFIRVLDNPRRTVPCAMNEGIRRTRGEVIVRLDAHSRYPRDYVSRCVRLLLSTGAACAGGRVLTMPNGEGPWARAVAAVTSHVVGVGDSRFRTSRRAGYVDTVPLGTFRREVFERVGLFDERLTRNQDNELTARIRRAGYKIAFDPSIHLVYWNQKSLKGLVHQGFHTGKWNVYTLWLYPYTWKASRFVPAAFVLYLAVLALVVPEGRPALTSAAAAPLALYGALVASIAAARGSAGGGALRVAATVIAYHVSYGVGTHLGVANLLTGRWRAQLGRPLRP